MSCGINRLTGQPLYGWAHVVQSISVIFSTRIGSRIMRRLFGSAVPGLLGKNLEPSTLLRFYTAIIVAIELWEPRFRVRQITYPPATNSAANLGQGKFGFNLVGDYMPNAIEGDFTVASPQSLTL